MKVVFFLVLFLHSGAFCQKVGTGVLYSYSTKNPVPYATVQVLNRGNAIDTDENGYFEIMIQKTDSLVFSCIGFNDKIFAVADLQKTDPFF